jgi:glutathione S-transferase
MTATPAIFITIPLSHYCEKARWALDRLGVPYREQPHAPLLHRLATRRHQGGSVPILVHDGQCIVDSTAILEYADAFGGGDRLYPRDPATRQEVSALEEQFDAHLGPHVRRWAYLELLARPALLRSIWSRGVPGLEALAIRMLVPLARRLVRSAYKVTPDGAQRSLERVRESFRLVEQRLADGRRYLVGGRFSAADLAFAALAAPALLPPECRAVHPAFEELSGGMQREISALRATVAGQFALRLFAQERAPAAG